MSIFLKTFPFWTGKRTKSILPENSNESDCLVFEDGKYIIDEETTKYISEVVVESLTFLSSTKVSPENKESNKESSS